MAINLTAGLFSAASRLGVPLAGGFVYTYARGTTTLQPSYTDRTLSVENTNPVVLDLFGRAPIWLDESLQYTIRVCDIRGVVQYEQELSFDDVTRAALQAATGPSLIGFSAASLPYPQSSLGGASVRRINPAIFGADLTGTTSSSAAILAALNKAHELGWEVELTGTLLIGSTVTWSKDFRVVGDGTVKILDPNLTAFELAINASTGNLLKSYWRGPRYSGPLTNNATSILFKVTGDNLTSLQNSTFEFRGEGMGVLFKDEKSPRTTGFGLEGQCAWNRFNFIDVENVGLAGIWTTQGTGTGNIVGDGTFKAYFANAIVWRAEGVGCVCGDVVFGRLQTSCTLGGGAVFYIGPNTVYRAHWAIGAVQMDAGMDFGGRFSDVGAVTYETIVWQGNNNGGAVGDVAGQMQPMLGSIIYDQQVDDRKGGWHIKTTSFGAHSFNLFEVKFAPYGQCEMVLWIAGLQGGVGPTSQRAQRRVWIQNDGSALTITPMGSVEETNSAAGKFVITVTDIGSLTARINFAFTDSSASDVMAQFEAGGHKYNVARKVL